MLTIFLGAQVAHDLDTLCLSIKFQEVELVHSRLKALSHLNLQRFGKHLKKLCLRQNFISILDPEIFSALSELSELDLYDNKIKHVGSCLESLPHLR